MCSTAVRSAAASARVVRSCSAEDATRVAQRAAGPPRWPRTGPAGLDRPVAAGSTVSRSSADACSLCASAALALRRALAARAAGRACSLRPWALQYASATLVAVLGTSPPLGRCAVVSRRRCMPRSVPSRLPLPLVASVPSHRRRGHTMRHSASRCNSERRPARAGLSSLAFASSSTAAASHRAASCARASWSISMHRSACTRVSSIALASSSTVPASRAAATCTCLRGTARLGTSPLQRSACLGQGATAVPSLPQVR